MEIWLPYGPVEVSFDIKQENLSHILEPQPKKLEKEEIDRKIVESAGIESVLILSSTNGSVRVFDALLSANKGISKILYPKQFGALARRKAQEFQVPSVEELNVQNMEDAGNVDGSPARIFGQIKSSSNLLILTSVHYDPLFGLTSSASDLQSLSLDSKSDAFKRSIDELPCSPSKSNASWYATRVLQTCPNVSVMEVIEKTGTDLLQLSYGEPESTHARTMEYWNSNLSVNLPSKAERIIFGSGGEENDRTLSAALSRSFFNVALNASLSGSGAQVCMLAECAQGLGSEALFRYVTGRFVPGAKLDQISYFDGLEVLLSFYRIQGEVDLSMISTLPKYYGEKFQFRMFSGAREAPSAVISQGSRAKILVIPDASSTVFALGA